MATQLLVSVRDVHEAKAAASAGVDILDVKEPTSGPLGRASHETWRAIASLPECVDVPLSLALGELCEWTADRLPGLGKELEELASLEGGPRLSWVKVGLAHESSRRDWPARLEMLSAALPVSLQLVVALYADCNRAESPVPQESVEIVSRLGCPFLLIDTWSKDRRWCDWLSVDAALGLLESCHDRSMGLALAGSLRREDLETWPETASLPDILAVRGAVCRAGRRENAIDRSAVVELVEVVARRSDQSLSIS